MYKFRLEPVLKQRKNIEETLQKELTEVDRELAAENNRLSLYRKSKSKLAADIYQKQTLGITASENLLYQTFITRLMGELQEQEQKVLKIKKYLVKKRHELVEAMKKRKTLDTLKEKQMAEYSKDMRKRELDFLNEVAINRFIRQQRR